jgi:SSS family solute:Na+ symporter
MPEFLERRFDHSARTVMSIMMMVTYVAVTIAAVIYSGARTADVFFGEQLILGMSINVTTASWIIGALAAVYVAAGGLKACAWADLLQGSALILGGAIVLVLALRALGNADPAAMWLSPELTNAGGLERFRELNRAKLHMVLPASDQYVPWTALAIGLWIPNFYYWGLNQYIIQRTLGSKSLAEGQKGTVFAAAMKLIIPFIVVFPGIIAFNLFSDEMRADADAKDNAETLALLEKHKASPTGSGIAFQLNRDFAKTHPELASKIAQFNGAATGISVYKTDLPDVNEIQIEKIRAKNASLPPGQQIVIQKELIGYKFDSAFGLLIKNLIPPGLRGFLLAAILGAVISSLAAMLNAASTIFTLDIYRQYVHRSASERSLVLVGRVCVIVFVVIGCVVAPWLDDPRFGGIFTYIQEFQGFISPGILGVFLFGLFVKRAPRICGLVGLLLSPVVYGTLKLVAPEMAFLDRMAITFACVLVALGLLTLLRPLEKPIEMPVNTTIVLESSRGAKVFGVVVILVTLALYAYFW